MLNLMFFHVFSDLQWQSEAVKKRAKDCISTSRKIKQLSSPGDDEPIKFESCNLRSCAESILFLLKHVLIPQFSCFSRDEMRLREMPFKSIEE